MPRARTIKPGYFKNELLAQIHPLGRILFAGLWCLADRLGRLEDRPPRIKAEVLPYDEADVDHLLDELTVRGFITRYTASGERYIQVVKFRQHQTPHKNETPSVIPPPDVEPSTSIHGSKDSGAATIHGSSEHPKRTRHDRHDPVNLILDPCVLDPGDLPTKERSINRKGTAQADEAAPQAPAPVARASVSHRASSHGDDTTPDGDAAEATPGVSPPSRPSVTAATTDTYSPEFQEFMANYPKPVRVVAAWHAWQSVVRQGASPKDLIASARHFAQHMAEQGQEERYIPLAKTFLGPERLWEEYVSGVPQSSLPRPKGHRVSSGSEPRGMDALRRVAARLGVDVDATSAGDGADAAPPGGVPGETAE